MIIYSRKTCSYTLLIEDLVVSTLKSLDSICFDILALFHVFDTELSLGYSSDDNSRIYCGGSTAIDYGRFVTLLQKL